MRATIPTEMLRLLLDGFRKQDTPVGHVMANVVEELLERRNAEEEAIATVLGRLGAQAETMAAEREGEGS